MADTDKFVYLPQLQRYDEKLKRWANNEFLAKADAAATDVRINGKSITADGVADIPLASTTQEGVIKYDPYGGLSSTERGYSITPASNTQINDRNASHFAITADSHLDYAVKAAMCDGKGAAWTDREQAAAKERMGIDDYSLPKATTTILGGVKVGNGLNVTDDGTLSVETHSSETLITTSITATYDNTGTWNAVCEDTYDVIVSWFDNYDRVFVYVNSGENSLRPFPQVFVELVKMQEGLIVSTPFTIQYVVPSNNPRVRTGMTTTALCQIYFDADGSIDFQMSYSEVDQYADATEFTNTVNGSASMLALKDGGITSSKLTDGAVTADKIADGAITKAKLASDVVASDMKYAQLTRFSSDNPRRTSEPIIGNNVFYIENFPGDKDTTGVVAYTLIDYQDFIGVVFKHIFITEKVSSISIRFVDLQGKPTIYEAWIDSGLIAPFPNATSTMPTYTTSSWSSTGAMQASNQQPVYWVPKSTSAQVALASLLPVQDECEEMEAEVAKLEQDWIDPLDETVAVDGNGVPITIATKNAELEKKRAELEKLREDYFSKLGDWKNEVQE